VTITEVTAPPLLSVHDLSVTFSGGRSRRRQVRAVDDVSFDIPMARTVALVGESGSGKSSIGNAVLGLARASSGFVEFHGERIIDATTVMRDQITQRIQVIFQDPFGSLNPSRTIGQTMVEPLLVRRHHFEGDRAATVDAALTNVGLSPDVATRYPSQFSGGQRQRIAIARAMITRPELVICDEPVSSLDLSVQAQILNLLAEQQQRFQLSYLFISHDLAVVRRFADSVLVLYRGRIVERGPITPVTTTPRHPYTVALLNAAPVPDPDLQRIRRERRRQLSLKVSDGDAHTRGCSFAPRCPMAIARCIEERPELRVTPEGTESACHRLDDVGQLYDGGIV